MRVEGGGGVEWRDGGGGGVEGWRDGGGGVEGWRGGGVEVRENGGVEVAIFCGTDQFGSVNTCVETQRC